jgi:hypothetical protein
MRTGEQMQINVPTLLSVSCLLAAQPAAFAFRCPGGDNGFTYQLVDASSGEADSAPPVVRLLLFEEPAREVFRLCVEVPELGGHCTEERMEDWP